MSSSTSSCTRTIVSFRRALHEISTCTGSATPYGPLMRVMYAAYSAETGAALVLGHSPRVRGGDGLDGRLIYN